MKPSPLRQCNVAEWLRDPGTAEAVSRLMPSGFRLRGIQAVLVATADMRATVDVDEQSINLAANALYGRLREQVSEAVCEELDELHPDAWRAIAEVALRTGRGEVDSRPFTTCPELRRA